jgi:exopolyphosphatase/guanosine-5'-triphosphate,3'-diphosphate pyrophosphatase
MPRMGRDVDARGEISVKMFDRIAWILNEYKALSVQLRCDRIAAVATSAVRDAANQRAFLDYLKSATGIAVEVLSGQEEAEWSYVGALNGLTGVRPPLAVVDVGGGSTELTFGTQGNGHAHLQHISTQLGSVRLTERSLKHAPPLPEEIDSARRLIIEEWAQVRNPGFHAYGLVGVAGTATTLAALDLGLQTFEVERISGHRMAAASVVGWCRRLCSMTPDGIRALSATAEGRADILAAGALILAETMQLFGFPELTVSERGLRYGIAVREARRG